MSAVKKTPFTSDPICLSVSGTLTPTQPLQIGAQALQATFLRQPIVISEIRFLFVMESPNFGTSQQFQPTPAAYVRLQARAGRFSMTHSPNLPGVGTGLVPVATLCSRINAAAEYGFFPGNYNRGTHAGNNSPASYCVWKFDRPMAMPLGTAPELMFQYVTPGPVNTTPDIQVYVSVVGHMIDDMPTTIHVPYASAWIPQSGVQDTSENDFKNLTGQTVRTRKIVARAYQLVTPPSTFTFWQELVRPDPGATGGLGTVDYSKTAKMQLFDDLGRGVLREPLSYGSLWPEDTLTLPFHYDLKHGKHIAASYSGTNIPSNTTWMPCYSLLGSREEKAY